MKFRGKTTTFFSKDFDNTLAEQWRRKVILFGTASLKNILFQVKSLESFRKQCRRILSKISERNDEKQMFFKQRTLTKDRTRGKIKNENFLALSEIFSIFFAPNHHLDKPDGFSNIFSRFFRFWAKMLRLFLATLTGSHLSVLFEKPFCFNLAASFSV